MALLVAEFFGIIGVDVIPPSNMAELIPYMLTVVVGVCLVCGVFAILGKLVSLFFDRRWIR